MQVRELLATYLSVALGDERNSLPMARARADLPPPVLETLLSEYREAANKQGLYDYTTPGEFLTPAEIEDLIDRLKSKKAPFKDARASVTFYPDSGSARVRFASQGNLFGDTIVRSADELWKLLRRAATDGIDFQAPKPTPYFIDSPEEWLKTHRPTKAAQKKIFQDQQVKTSPAKGPNKKKASMSLEQILALDIKL